MPLRIFLLLLVSLGVLSADTVVFKNGSTVDGTLISVGDGIVRIAVGDRVMRYGVERIDSIRFGAAQRPAAEQSSGTQEPAQQSDSAPPPPRDSAQASDTQPSTPDTASAPPPAPPSERRYDTSGYDSRAQNGDSAPPVADPSGMVLPAGSNIVIRMIDSVDSEKAQVGEHFRASLDQPIVIDGQTVIARGADVTTVLTDAQQSGKFSGQTILKLDVTSINANGRTYYVQTGGVAQASSGRGNRTAKVVGGTAALGAIIGAIAGGGEGAAIGAGAGAAAGAGIQVATSGQRVQIPSETLLTFTLKNDLDF